MNEAERKTVIVASEKTAVALIQAWGVQGWILWSDGSASLYLHGGELCLDIPKDTWEEINLKHNILDMG